jgi:hypothetical protein
VEKNIPAYVFAVFLFKKIDTADRSFETADFYREIMEFANLSLGLIYDSIALSQSRSGDTVPLMLTTIVADLVYCIVYDA